MLIRKIISKTTKSACQNFDLGLCLDIIATQRQGRLCTGTKRVKYFTKSRHLTVINEPLTNNREHSLFSQSALTKVRTCQKWSWDSSRWSSPRISLVKGERYVRDMKKTQSWFVMRVLRLTSFWHGNVYLWFKSSHLWSNPWQRVSQWYTDF